MLGALSSFAFAIGFAVAEEASRQAVCTHVARILREERQRQKLSMTALSAQAGLSQQSVSYVERGMRIPNLDTLLRITEVLNVELARVLKQAAAAASRSRGK